MGKLIFRYTEDDMIDNNREASEIELTVPDDMNIQEYKVMCVRLASAMGYSEKTIQKGFGDLVFGEENINTIKDLLDELGIPRTT
jgi:hypothetical protein